MNARTVAYVAADIYSAAAHGVASGVARVAVYDYLSAVHCVARGLLNVAVNYHLAAVHICAERVAGHAVYYYALARKAVGYVPLTDAAVYSYICILTFAHDAVKRLEMHVFIYGYFHNRPPC